MIFLDHACVVKRTFRNASDLAHNQGEEIRRSAAS